MRFTLPTVLLAGISASTAVAAPPTPDQSRAVYERIKGWSGEWVGESTKGWKETISYRVIAKGSVVMESSFDAHPNETMISMYHPDGDRLLLTHYCVARNQPRLVLSDVAEDLSVATFTFLDGTNLPSRDKGHMDKLVVKFNEDGSLTKQWTWYQNGNESWLEEIRLTRAPATAPAGEKNSDAAPAQPAPKGGHDHGTGTK